MKKVINIYKPVGITPLQAINKFKKLKPEYKNEKIGYAGRLDPMAEGLLILLVGNENKRAQNYLNLEKNYEFEVLFGINTDTYDTLGLLTSFRYITPPKNIEKNIKKFLKLSHGLQTQTYPPFSSKTVKGKPLFYWARKGKLAQLKIPEKTIEIFSLKISGKYMLSKTDIKNTISQRINTIKGDFRQKSIAKSWDQFFKTNRQKEFQIFNFQLSCSSGTYVRSIVNQLGKELKCGAIALNIKRTQVGLFQLKNSLIIE